jgi:hypothetical protein
LRFLGRLHDDPIHAHQQEASEKRQGTKSRAVEHPTVQERLWGSSCADEVYVAALASSSGCNRDVLAQILSERKKCDFRALPRQWVMRISAALQTTVWL